MKSFSLKILTPERTVFSGNVTTVVVPALDGSMGILAGHAPLVSGLDVGPLRLEKTDGTVEFFAVSGGFVEVANDEVRVLADISEPADEIDEDRARKAEVRARERLKNHSESDFDLARAEAALARALLRVHVSGLRRHQPKA